MTVQLTEKDKVRLHDLFKRKRSTPAFQSDTYLEQLDDQWEKRPRLFNSIKVFNPNNIYRKHMTALSTVSSMKRKQIVNDTITLDDVEKNYNAMIEVTHSIAKVLEHKNPPPIEWFDITGFYSYPAEIFLYVFPHVNPNAQQAFFNTVMIWYAKYAARPTIFKQLKEFISLLLHVAPDTFMKFLDKLEFEKKPYRFYRKVGGVNEFKIIDFALHTSPNVRLDARLIPLIVDNAYTLFDVSTVTTIFEEQEDVDKEDIELLYQQLERRLEDYKDEVIRFRQQEERADNFIAHSTDKEHFDSSLLT